MNDDILDLDRIENLRSIAGLDNGSFLRELVDLFFEDASARIAGIRKAATDRDAETLRTTAHTLKGSCTNIGAAAMADLCLRIERRGRDRELDDVDDLVSGLLRIFDDTRAELSEIR